MQARPVILNRVDHINPTSSHFSKLKRMRSKVDLEGISTLAINADEMPVNRL